MVYNDVLAACGYYIAHENNGRGVVLGRKQPRLGSLTRFLDQDEIDGKQGQDKVTSAF